MANIEGLTIRPLNAGDSFEAMTELLHRAYAVLAAHGWNYTASYQAAEVTATRASRGECWVASLGGVMIGTITLVGSDKHVECDWYDRSDVAIFGQFAVTPEYQGCGVGQRLLECVEDLAKRFGANEIACDTADVAHDLIDWYVRRGYRRVALTQWPGKTYSSVILSKSLL